MLGRAGGTPTRSPSANLPWSTCRPNRTCLTCPSQKLYDLYRAYNTWDEIPAAERLSIDLVGRNILPGRWSFQVIEEYDDGYYAAFKDHERQARDRRFAEADGRRRSEQARAYPRSGYL